MAQLHFFSFFLEREKDRKKEREAEIDLQRLLFHFFFYSSVFFCFQRRRRKGGGTSEFCEEAFEVESCEKFVNYRKNKNIFCRQNLSRGLICDKVFVFVGEVRDALL